MTIEEIIKELSFEESYYYELIAGTNEIDCIKEAWKRRVTALREAIALLNTHKEAQPNDPLTLEELMEMDGQPVYLALDKKWYIVSVNYEPPRGEAQPCGIDLWGAGTSLRLLAKCGMYRRPPKEKQNA